MAVRLAEEGAQVFAVDRDADSLAETLDRAGALRSSSSHLCLRCDAV
jgi:NADP-dependent 3-hydroxy acid dehydrogenase YdfG